MVVYQPSKFVSLPLVHFLVIKILKMFVSLSVHKIVTWRNSQFKKRLVLIYSGSHEWSQQRTIKRSPCWSTVLLQVWKTWTGYIQGCKNINPQVKWGYYVKIFQDTYDRKWCMIEYNRIWYFKFWVKLVDLSK